MFEQFFGNYLIQKKLITSEQFADVLETQKSSRVKLGLIAVAEKMLTPRQTYEINMLQVTLDKRFGDIAVDKGYLTPDQVSHLLSLQGNPYLLFAQTLAEKNIMTLAEVEDAVLRYKEENNFTDDDIEAIKSGDIDRITNVFIKINAPLYNDMIALAIRNIIRFIDTSVSFSEPIACKTYRFENLASQCLKGDHDILLGFAGKGNSLLTIATPYANIANPYEKEEFTEVDEDSLDAVCEFTNVINGLFASKLSYEDINIDMLPPITYNDNELVSEGEFYVVPLKINSSDIDLVISVDAKVVVK
jgi:CheY-specific phosphatase CheX